MGDPVDPVQFDIPKDELSYRIPKEESVASTSLPMSPPDLEETEDEIKNFRKDEDDTEPTTAQSSAEYAIDTKDIAFEVDHNLDNTENAPRGFMMNAEFAASIMRNQMLPLLMSRFPMPQMQSPGAALLSPFNHLSMFSPVAPQVANPLLSFAGMPGMMNPMMNPMMAMLAANAANQQQQQQQQSMSLPSSNFSTPRSAPTSIRRAKLPKDHIKKPCNAFMMFIKTNRNRVKSDAVKQSSEVNKELGRMWKELSEEEQKPYFEMAKVARDEHAIKYPNWSPRDNYAIHKKQKKIRQQETHDEADESKKCRARFGVEQKDMWCTHCKRKKRCLNVRDSCSPDVSSTTP